MNPIGMPRRDALIPAALSYAERGWHVFPLRPGDKRPAFPAHTEDRCTDSGREKGYRADVKCRRAGRHVTWEERATTDAARIMRAWQTITPDGPYGIGIACGPSGLVVLDLDVPKPDRHGVVPTPPPEWNRPGIVDGSDVLTALAADAGEPWPFDTWTVCTGSGGAHLYFAYPVAHANRAMESGLRTVREAMEQTAIRNTAGTLGWLIDTRARGGYVVAPPTVVNGHRYEVGADIPVTTLPDWLADRLTPKPIPTGRTTVQLTTAQSKPGRSSRYLDAAIGGQLDRITDAAKGGRNDALYHSAIALGQLVAGGELDPDYVTQILEAAALDVGLEPQEIARTIASGLRAGAKRPRTITQPTKPIQTAPQTAATMPGAAA
ncbi:bifunctional DNA primase/polymerase [Spongisporangium articulatum]|uniref:Bifunctional DNA primase/polymerase n=1 Tax=Spongisporangium articulatum TaxID=3362603 RepID=A0ABW8AKV7_9ACTN